MFPMVRSHLEYQDFVTQQLKTYYVGGVLSLQNDDWILIEKLWPVDLSRTFSLLKDTFSRQGPCPYDPADLLRSYILMHLTGTFSVTKWVTALRRVPLFAVLTQISFYNPTKPLYNGKTQKISVTTSSLFS